MIQILISDKLGAAGLAMLDEAADVSYDMKPGLSKEELIAIMPAYDGLIIRSGTQVDADVLAAGRKLKVVGRAGIGVDNVDVDAATKQSVIVMNTPGSNSVATAEQTMALMLAVTRHIVPAHHSLAAGEWNRAQFTGTELYGKVLGVIGFGRIGRLVAERAKAFGMTVLAHDPFVKAEDAAKLGVSLVTLERVFSQADYLTLHTAVTRHIVPAHLSLAAGEWNRAQFTGTELFGKVLGIVGFGRIGRLVAERAKAFGMTVLAHDPFVKAEDAAKLGISLVTLDRVFSQADYLTLHTAVTPATTKMINCPAIKKMKKGVIIINVARGKLVDEAALAEALQDGHVKAAAIDVYSSEPPAADNPLIGLPNVLHTPHLGASTVEAQRNVATQIVSQVLDCLRGVGTRNAMNKIK